MKYIENDIIKVIKIVSLFTREWIEITGTSFPYTSGSVSLFTREWIEMVHDGADGASAYSLPLYEGVD